MGSEQVYRVEGITIVGPGEFCVTATGAAEEMNRLNAALRECEKDKATYFKMAMENGESCLIAKAQLAAVTKERDGLREAADTSKRLEHLLRQVYGKLRLIWSFNDYQEHTHTWHTKEDFLDWLDKKTSAALLAAGEGEGGG